MRVRLVLAAVLLAAVLISVASGSPASSGLRVSGNRLVIGPGAGRAVQLRGVSRSGAEYVCITNRGFFDGPDPARVDTRAMVGAMAAWNIDVVRVPMNEDCWLGVNAPARWGGIAYRQAIEGYVHRLEAAHLFVILDLHWAAPGLVPAIHQAPMADADHAPAFWRSVGAAFRGDDHVLFDLFNEPYGIDWRCWLRGCEVPATGTWPAYRTAGMQQLVDAVRASGATQPLLLGGLHYASSIGGWIAHEPTDPLHQLVASVHRYGGANPCGSSCGLGTLATARRVPVVLGELGEFDCAHRYVDSMMRFADRHGISYLGWAWDPPGPGSWTCAGGPSLITSFDGTPTPYGVGFRNHFRARGVAIRP